MTKLYLISPPKIELKTFAPKLKNALKTNQIPVFQLRLKDIEKNEIIKIAKEIKKICCDFNCLFILNDDYKTAIDLELSGVHVGFEDGEISNIRKNSPPNFIIGASCYDSCDLAIEAGMLGADYVSFGTFFSSITKNSKGKPKPEILSWCDEILNIPTVAIGGITADNCKILIDAKADFLAIISYIWNHPKGEEFAIKTIVEKI
jgi:thiamine-phosphate pyrophosphorylase